MENVAIIAFITIGTMTSATSGVARLMPVNARECHSCCEKHREEKKDYMEEIKKKLEEIILDCVEHHGYQDDDEVPVNLTIKEVKELIKILRCGMI